MTSLNQVLIPTRSEGPPTSRRAAVPLWTGDGGGRRYPALSSKNRGKSATGVEGVANSVAGGLQSVTKVLLTGAALSVYNTVLFVLALLEIGSYKALPVATWKIMLGVPIGLSVFYIIVVGLTGRQQRDMRSRLAPFLSHALRTVLWTGTAFSLTVLFAELNSEAEVRRFDRDRWSTATLDALDHRMFMQWYMIMLFVVFTGLREFDHQFDNFMPSMATARGTPQY